MPRKANRDELLAFVMCVKCDDVVEQERVSRWKTATDKYRCANGHLNVLGSTSDCKVIEQRKRKYRRTCED